MIARAISSDPVLRSLLASHPRVERVESGDNSGLEFIQGDWSRKISIGNSATALHGLVELMDNNPMVCADEVSVPSAGVTLALIALGPLISVGLLVEEPTVLVNNSTSADELDAFLAAEGWANGASIHVEEMDFGGVVAATVMAVIRTPDSLDEIDDLYEERFGRSFFVRRNEEGVWDAELVKNAHYAVYRLRIAPDEPNSLLTIRVLADENGKAGASQVVHAMNVMAGFEESMGIA